MEVSGAEHTLKKEGPDVIMLEVEKPRYTPSSASPPLPSSNEISLARTGAPTRTRALLESPEEMLSW